MIRSILLLVYIRLFERTVAIYVFLKMCIFEVIHFIVETSKTVGTKRKNKINCYNAIQNSIVIEYLIYLKLRR